MTYRRRITGQPDHPTGQCVCGHRAAGHETGATTGCGQCWCPTYWDTADKRHLNGCTVWRTPKGMFAVSCSHAGPPRYYVTRLHALAVARRHECATSAPRRPPRES